MRIAFIIITLLWLCTPIVNASLDDSRDEIQERIKPVGIVNIENTTTTSEAPTSPKTPQTPKTEQAKSDTGQSTYEHHCIVCHKDGIAGAPKFRDDAAWKPRLAANDINALVASAIKGKNAMPAKGTCQECSDSDIKAAIEYMLPKK